MLSPCVTVTSGLMVLALATGAFAVTLHVSPQGNDAWSGRLKRPNTEGTDGPLASLRGARDVVRNLRSSGESPDAVKVLVEDGLYQMDEPFVLSPEDSGTATCPVSYEAAPHARPVISGGREISGWTKGQGDIWVAQVPEAQSGSWSFNQLFVKGRRAIRARHPNEGYLRTTGQLPGFERPQEHQGKKDACMGFAYKPGDLKPWDNQEDVVISLYHSWTNSIHWIQSLEEDKSLVHFSNTSGWPVGYWDANNQRYHVENFLEALDQPGEWYLDRKAGRLYYWPREGENLDKDTVTAPVLTQLLRVEGRPDAGQFVSHVTVRGLSFQHCDWEATRDREMDGQAATFLTAAVHLRGARHVALEDVEVAHVGGYGVWLDEGSQDNRLVQCHIHDLAGGGVRIGTGSSPKDESVASDRNQVDNCFIHDGGRVFNGACGVLIQRASTNQITHCEIADFLYTGVSVGWSWGYAESSANHNLIADNHIHHLGYGIMSDMGGIYCLGIAPGTELRHNHIHHVMAYSYGGWGLYTDEGSTNVLLEDNVVYKTKTGGFHQHYGKENTVRNNIFAFAMQGLLQRSRQEEHTSFFFERNIMLTDNGVPLHGNWSNERYVMDNNLYWDIKGNALTWDKEDWAGWQKRHDQHSLVADPKFKDAEHSDFRLQKDSPAEKIGFKEIDLKGVGLYGEKSWVRMPKTCPPPDLEMKGP